MKKLFGVKLNQNYVNFFRHFKLVEKILKTKKEEEKITTPGF